MSRVDRIEKLLILTRHFTRSVKYEDYRIVEKLGAGSSGIVFQCKVNIGGTDRMVALKMVANFHGVVTPEQFASAFGNEISILDALEIHPNIIYIFTGFVAKPTAQMLENVHESVRYLCFTTNATGRKIVKETQFFVSEFHPLTLKQKLKELGDKINGAKKQGFKYSLQCARVLSFLQDHCVFHRNIHPRGILISESDDIILTSFGEAVKTNENYLLPRQDLRAGNVAFTSPEVLSQIRTKQEMLDLSKQSSWELGLLMHIILVGKMPFPEYPNGCDIPTLTIDTQIPLGLAEIIIGLLKGNPEERMGIKEALGCLEAINKQHYQFP